MSGPAAAGAAAHVFVADLGSPTLDDDDLRHLAQVLRLRRGEEVTASDGLGRWRPCRYAGAADLEPAGEVLAEDPPRPEVTVGFALLKGDRPEWVVQKLTELGVDRIVPVRTQRCVVRWEPAKAARQVERLARVAREAAMQSRRTRLPEVAPVTDFSALGDDSGLAGAALAHPGGDRPSLARPTVLVGPEGGWTAEELGAGMARVDLGPTVLRAETAAVTAGALLCALRAGVVDGPGDHSSW